MHRFTRILLVNAGLAAVLLLSASAQPLVSPQLAQGCETCHGKGGDSQKPDVPRLNGQLQAYLLTRLKEFLDPTSGTPHANKMMWENATKIRDDEAVALTRYFSSQAPTRPSNSGMALSEAGAGIYRNGAPPDIPACAACHGLDAQGLGDAPRLAGQHETYLVDQLNAFSLATRVGKPMNRHAWDMPLDQMKAVAAWLANN